MTPYYEQDGITIYHGDAYEVLPEIESIDLLVSDPPYVFGMKSNGNNGKGTGWSDLMNNARLYAPLLREFKRVTAVRNGAAWVFTSWRSLPVLMRASLEAEWGIESLLVWDKGPEVGMGGPRGLRAQYELIALYTHPEFRIANRSTKDIWNVPWGGSSPREFHPAQKPTSLLQRIIEVSGEGVVLDPFMGSGTTLVAARLLGRKAIGIEGEERYCEIAAQRLSQGVLDFGGAP